MCAIAGILFKNDRRSFDLTTGEALTKILDATVHRGMDSCGWALYKDPIKDTIRMRFFIPTDESADDEIKRIEKIKKRAIRHITKAKYNAHTSQLFKELK